MDKNTETSRKKTCNLLKLRKSQWKLYIFYILGKLGIIPTAELRERESFPQLHPGHDGKMELVRPKAGCQPHVLRETIKVKHISKQLNQLSSELYEP